MRIFTTIRVFSTAVIFVLTGSVATANDYPSRPITIIVPVSAGGTSDLFARIVANELRQKLNTPVVIDNRAGAGGAIGSAAVARAKPDGYTLLLASGGTHSINPSVYKSLPYDAIKDFAPVTRLAVVPNLLVVPKDLPVSSVKELRAYITKQAGKVSFGSSGVGTSIQLTGEMFKQVAGVQMTHVPYKGSAPAIADLIGGHLTLMFDNMPSALPQVKRGALKALAVTSKERSSAAPEIPTMVEEGYPSFDVTTWFGVLAPAGTPKDTVQKLHKAIAEILQDKNIRQKFISAGAEPAPIGTDEFARYMKEQIAVWSKVASQANIQID
jgi:tripartite-type tricarboxylate transporter receptor subunit TctC